MGTSEWTDFVVNFMESFKTNGLKTAMALITGEMWDYLTEPQSEWLQATTSTLRASAIACGSDSYQAISAYRQELLYPR